MKRILVSGSRDWTDSMFIKRSLCSAVGLLFPESDIWEDGFGWSGTTLVHGACPTGADYIADYIATEFGIAVIERHPADWSLGRRAGYIRNKEMVDTGADLVLVFCKNNSRGASMTARLAREAGLPVIEYKVNTGATLEDEKRSDFGNSRPR